MKKKPEVKDEFIRKRIERQKRIRKRRLTIFFIFFTVLMISVGITLSLTVFFPIKKIVVSGSKLYTAEEIIQCSGIDIGDNIFTVSAKKAQKSLKESKPYVESIKIKRDLPGTLEIIVTDAEEFACYNVNGRYYTVSGSNWVLKETAELPPNVVEIVTDSVKCKPGTEMTFTNDKPKKIIKEILSQLEEEGITPNKIDVTNSISIILKVEDRFDVELGNSNYIEEKIRHLSTVIENLGEGKKGLINLTFWTVEQPDSAFVEYENPASQEQSKKEK